MRKTSYDGDTAFELRTETLENFQTLNFIFYYLIKFESLFLSPVLNVKKDTKPPPLTIRVEMLGQSLGNGTTSIILTE